MLLFIVFGPIFENIYNKLVYLLFGKVIFILYLTLYILFVYYFYNIVVGGYVHYLVIILY